MTTEAMNCDRFSDRLMDYLEQDLDVTTRASIEAHAVACADCGALLADIRKLRVDASNLPELTPSRDLWTGIAQRIETPVVPIGAGAAGTVAGTGVASRGARRAMHRWLNAGLIAASLLAAAVLGYTARGGEQLAAGPGPAAPTETPTQITADQPAPVSLPEEMAAANPANAASSGPGTPAGGDAGVLPRSTPAAAPARSAGVQLAAATLTADYDREIGRLRLLIEQRRGQLDPVTVTVIERNLAVIDTAIAESRRAIANDPNSRFLLEILNQSLQAKVELMRTAALLPSRT